MSISSTPPDFFSNDPTSEEYIAIVKHVANALNIEFEGKHKFSVVINDKGEPELKADFILPINIIRYRQIRDEDCAIAITAHLYKDIMIASRAHDLNIFPQISEDDIFEYLYEDKLCFIVNNELYRYISENCPILIKYIEGTILPLFYDKIEEELILINDFIHYELR